MIFGSSSMKLALIVRTDLAMKKGKIASQCCHAAVACYRQALKKSPKLVSRWESIGEPKVVLRCGGEQELQDLMTAAKHHGLVAQVICDAGRTQVPMGTCTVLGIGPGETEQLDKVVSHLKLL